MNNLEIFLRNHCNLIDWYPTHAQLEKIAQEIKQRIESGEILNRTTCQNIIVEHCGSTRMFLIKGLDNSDLNTLLAMAIASVKKK
ncbi:MAG: hypothetical protein K2Y10_05250 [Burkholderiaceae bacterium]|nr:hypothetical protein [Burkholderiaceae bacterium]